MKGRGATDDGLYVLIFCLLTLGGPRVEGLPKP